MNGPAKLIEFNDDQRAQIIDAAREYLTMTDEAELNAFVENIEQTGQISAFGVGSLLDYSHLQNANGTFKDDLQTEFPGMNENNVFSTYAGSAQGIEATFCCFDIFYRGTEDHPGVTIGNEKVDGAETEGGLLITQLDHLDSDVAANFVERYLQRFNERECPPNMPIYKFEMKDIELRDGTMTKGLVCVADDEGPLYTRNVENRYAQGNPGSAYYMPDNEIGENRAAAVIAVAAGSPTDPRSGAVKPAGKVTDMDYLRNTIKGYEERDIHVPPAMIALYEKAGQFRERLEPSDLEHLESFEHKGMLSNKSQFRELFVSVARTHNAALNDHGADPTPTSEVA
ncbi:MAG: hypothetical protein JKY71_03405 [Alphaproteobacteria bacterium]|nr:hypothetical protein [Alphaproteobacteria bacterium]